MSTLLPGLFNVTDNAFDCPVLPRGDATTNTDNLNTWVQLLYDAESGPTKGQGGTLQFPAYEKPYEFDGPINIGLVGTETHPQSIIFAGTGQGSKEKVLLRQKSDSDRFVVANNPGEDDGIAGITFQDMFIECLVPSTKNPPSSAIRVVRPPSGKKGGGALNVRIFRVVFSDCPVALTFQHSGQCSMLECTVLSTGQNANAQVGVIVGDPTSDERTAIETYIADCYFQTFNYHAGQTGIAVYNSEHLRVMNTRIEAFAYGVVIKPTLRAIRTYFGNVSVPQLSQSARRSSTNGGALVIRPQTGGRVEECACVGCEFGPSTSVQTDYTGAGIVVDATEGTVDVLRFVSCTSIGWPGPGLQVVGPKTGNSPACAHLEIMGGEYSANGSADGPAGSGISMGGTGEVAGTISNLRIAAVSCVGSLGEAPTQEYGIYISDGASNVLVDHCDLSANTGSAAFVGTRTGGAPTNVFIRNCNATGYAAGSALQFSSPGTVVVTDCEGYNDQNAALHDNEAPLEAVSASGCEPPYYGPSLVIFSDPDDDAGNPLTVHLSGTGSYPMGFGTIYLPNASDRFYFSRKPQKFHWFGK